jgi:hypothetical protein
MVAGVGLGLKTKMDAFKRTSAGLMVAGVGLGTGLKRTSAGLGTGLKTEMDAFNRSSMERKADGILRSDSSSDIYGSIDRGS